MDDDLRPAIAAPLASGLEQVRRALARTPDPERFDPAVPEALRSAGLHLLTVPADRGGLGATLGESLRVLAALGAIDGSAALGFAMTVQVMGGAVAAGTWPPAPLERLLRGIRDEGAFVNSASSEEGTGSPARGGLPDTRAVRDGDDYRLTGEKTFTTWLPALRFALVTARIDEAPKSPGRTSATDSAPVVGHFLVDLELPGVERLAGFEAMGMRASASGRLRLAAVPVPADMLVARRRPAEPDPRGAATQAWFASCIAAVYLGVGEGARAEVVRWAIDRRPGDGSTAVADIPAVQIRLGRLDAALRSARIVLLDLARRWDGAPQNGRAGLMSDVQLAKVRAVNAAVEATDETLRIAGGPGYLAGPLERAFRDSRAGPINPPLDDVAYQGFAQALVNAERSRP